jgi:hypothetical protein
MNSNTGGGTGLTTRAERSCVPRRAAASNPLDVGPVNARAPKGQRNRAAPGIETICRELVELQRRRVFCIRSQRKMDNATLAYIRVALGYHANLSAAAREKISAAARRIKKAVERGEGEGSSALAGLKSYAVADCSTVTLSSASARQSWDILRDGTEAEMIRLAKLLPVYEWVADVRGVSALGLAVIVGEAGDLGRFPTRSHLQKRLGLGCMDGDVRQGNPPAKPASPEDWIRHGYSRRRRAEIWAFLDDTMFLYQWRGPLRDAAKEIIAPGYPLGPYGAHYERKKTEYLERGLTSGHADKAARRYMAKMFIRDLWKAWRATV